MRLLKNRSMRFYLVFFLILMMAVGGSAIAAFADSGGATATVTAGNLSETATYGETVSATLNGLDQQIGYSLPIQVTDATGSGAGWNLQISGTSLASGSHTLEQKVTAASGLCANLGTCTNIVSSSPPTLPFAISTSPTKFFEADANSGLGIFNIGTTVQVSVPGNAYAGTYTTTLSLASVSGP